MYNMCIIYTIYFFGVSGRGSYRYSSRSLGIFGGQMDGKG